MDKIVELIQSLFSSKIFWLIVIALCIGSLALLLLANTDLGENFFGITAFVDGESTATPTATGTPMSAKTSEPTESTDVKTTGNRMWIGLIALATTALIAAKIIIWLIKLIRNQLFA